LPAAAVEAVTDQVWLALSAGVVAAAATDGQAETATRPAATHLLLRPIGFLRPTIEDGR
jgi:hypothetical protein